jgi:hypothetical protein
MSASPSMMTNKHDNETTTEKEDLKVLAVSAEPSDSEPGDDEATFLEGWLLVSLASLLMAAAFMMSLDNTILGTELSPVKSCSSHKSQRRQYRESRATSIALTTSAGTVPHI